MHMNDTPAHLGNVTLPSQRGHTTLIDTFVPISDVWAILMIKLTPVGQQLHCIP